MVSRILVLVLLGQAVIPLLAQDALIINSFLVEQTKSSVRITLMFNNVAIGRSGCFFDKITFIGISEGSSSTGFTPRYPGTCEFNATASNFLVGTMDVADFVESLQFNYLTSSDRSYIVVRGSSPVTLVDGVSINPTSTPLVPDDFVPTTSAPRLVSFDIDWSTNQLLLHFDALLDSSSYNPEEVGEAGGEPVMLSAGPSSASLTALMTSTPGQGMYTTTLCISLSAADQTAIRENNICGSTSSCFCYFTSSLIADYNGNRVVAISISQPLQVTLLRRPGTPRFPVFMRLSLSYLSGCSAMHYLTEDEVYVLRPFEYVTRIDCFTDNRMNSSNIRPQLSRGSGNSDINIEQYIFFNWPLNTYLNFTRGVSSQLYGQFVCRSSVGYYVRNFVHDNNFSIELLDGARYRLPLHDPLTIPFYFGSYPQTDLTQSTIAILLINSEGGGVPIEPVYERVNPFHVNIRYDIVQEAISGSYDIRISEGTRIIARQPISIEITEPTISLLPEVVTIIPGQDEIVLECRTNSATLQVIWTSENSNTPLGFNNTYREGVPPSSREYTCSVRGPDSSTVLANATVLVRDVQGILSVWRDGLPIKNNSFIEISNRRSGNLNLQCFERTTSLANLTWIVLPNNGSLTQLVAGKNDIYTVVESGNQANLTVDNSLGAFRGLIKCFSSSGEIFNIRTVEDDAIQDSVRCEEETDSIWEVRWNETISGNRDFQPCPMTTGSVTRGVVLRQCHENGVWNDTVNITDCSSDSFMNLRILADAMVFRLRRAYSQEELSNSVSQLISALKNVTKPKPITHFPKDLDVANNVLVTLVDLLSEESLPAIHVELADVFDNLLHVNNTKGWLLLTEINDGSQRFLNATQAFGRYLLESINPQSENEITITRVNIVYSAMLINQNQAVQDNTYPADLSRGVQITLPPNILNGSTGVVHVVMKNLNQVLPRPNNLPGSESSQIVASSIISSQIKTASGYISSFNNNQVLTVQFLTERAARARDPVCLSWDAPGSEWLDTGVETIPPIEEPENGEFKVFRIKCSSDHLDAFGVAVTVPMTSQFRLSIPIYIGCGFVIFSSVLSLFSLLLSCLVDTLRHYSTVAFCVHLNFIASVLCAFIAFLAGIEQAIDHRIGCAAVAALLQYFFTAAFTWLLCEILLLVFFETFSKYCGLFLIIFIFGWGIPAIPTAISLGILHADYGTTTHCWFFFDGQISNEVVLGFIVPKLIIVGVTLLMAIIACITNCKFSNKKTQTYIRANVARILWFIWSSVLILLIFLAASWVFSLLLVNTYGLDSDISGWIFMAASILLSLWMFIFSAAIMITNQKVDYERLWSTINPVYPPTVPGREKGYQFMDMSNVDLSGRRTSTLTRPPTLLSNPVFGVENK